MNAPLPYTYDIKWKSVSFPHNIKFIKQIVIDMLNYKDCFMVYFITNLNS